MAGTEDDLVGVGETADVPPGATANGTTVAGRQESRAQEQAKRNADRVAKRLADKAVRTAMSVTGCRNCGSHAWRVVETKPRKKTGDIRRVAACVQCGGQTVFLEAPSESEAADTLVIRQAPKDEQPPLPVDPIADQSPQNQRRIVKTELADAVADLKADNELLRTEVADLGRLVIDQTVANLDGNAKLATKLGSQISELRDKIDGRLGRDKAAKGPTKSKGDDDDKPPPPPGGKRGG